MRQHPIPQNILDIEFKLFTKFTVREFTYMAIGVGFGGIFLYFFSKGQLPGIIAFPIFFVSSGLGLFLGLVPINDQKADVVLKNYITAITSPTQRVWKNKEMKEKMTQEEIEMTRGTMSRKAQQKNKARIIGTGTESIQKLEAQDTVEALDQEEKQRLDQIDQTAQKADVSAPPSPRPQQQVQATAPSPTVAAPQGNDKLVISRANAPQYSTPDLEGLNLVGTINLQVVDKAGTPIPNVITTIKDQEGRVIAAYRTNEKGLIFSDKKLNTGTYYVSIKADERSFPQVQIVLEGTEIMKLKITEI